MDEVKCQGFDFFQVVVVLLQGVEVGLALVKDLGYSFSDVYFPLNGDVFKGLSFEFSFSKDFFATGNWAISWSQGDFESPSVLMLLVAASKKVR